MNILEKASEITTQGRNLQYGEAENNFERIWQYNKAYLTNKVNNFCDDAKISVCDRVILHGFISTLSKEYVARQGLFIKLGRLDFAKQQDSYIDACGYLRCEAKIAGMDDVK
jgi:hypothetical protein